MPDLVKLLTGYTADQLKREGQKRYPGEDDALNRTAHRFGSRVLTEKYGPVVAQGLGVGNELYEALMMKLAGSQKPIVGWGANADIDLGDIGANIRGSWDAQGDMVQRLAEMFSRRR
jgi:hypothetical protein